MKDKEGIGIMNRHTPRKPAIKRGTVDVPWIAAYLGINLNAAYALARQPGFPCIRLEGVLLCRKRLFTGGWSKRHLTSNLMTQQENQ
jgi:hypothetical protein